MRSVVAALLSLGPALLFAAEPSWSIHAHGYGPVRVGMTVKEAEDKLGTPLELHESEMVGGCFIGAPKKKHQSLYLMIDGGVVTHVGTGNKDIPSDAGIRVGDKAEAVKERHKGKLQIEDHKYQDGAYYYFVWEADRKHGLEYEIDPDGRVHQIRGGDSTIQLVEGLS